MSRIVLEQVSKEFSEDFTLFEDLNATLDHEAVNFLVGRSGVGKTTFLQLLAGLLRPTSGALLVNDIDIAQMKESDLMRYRRYVGFVTQNSSLVLGRSVFENVAMPLWIGGLREREIRHRVETSLRIVGMEDASKVKPIRLSSGERQRVSIARAIVHRPKLLIADEPTGNFDRDLALEVLGLFDQFVERNTIVVVATHDPNLVADAQRVFELEDSTISVLRQMAPDEDRSEVHGD